MLNRRTFLRATGVFATSNLVRKAHICHGMPHFTSAEPAITGLEVIRLREPGSSKSRAFLVISTDAGIRGVSGELYQKTPQRLTELKDRLSGLLVGRNPHDREMDNLWLWNQLHPLCGARI